MEDVKIENKRDSILIYNDGDKIRRVKCKIKERKDGFLIVVTDIKEIEIPLNNVLRIETFFKEGVDSFE